MDMKMNYIFRLHVTCIKASDTDVLVYMDSSSC